MAGDDSTAAMQAIESLLHILNHVARTSATGFCGPFRNDSTDLSRRVASLSPFLEEIRHFLRYRGPLDKTCSSSSFRCSISQLTAALTAANMLLQSAGCLALNTVPKATVVEFTSQFQSVSCELDKALANFPYRDFEISEEVKQQVDTGRGQLKRAKQRHGDAVVIPDDFICPISLQLFTDPVIVVSTGQTYERSCIQRWFNNGYRTCPKSCQTLEDLTLTPNHVLRSLIAEWCKDHNVEQPTLPKNKPTVANPSTRSMERQRLIQCLLCMLPFSPLFILPIIAIYNVDVLL